MNLNLMDPKLIALAVAVVLLIVVAIALYTRPFRAGIRPGGSTTWVRT
jgi:hypothetical protein